MPLYLSRDLMVASSAMASTTWSRPSSDWPTFQNFARGGDAGELLVIAIDVLGISQLAGSAGDAAEEFQRRGDGVGGGHVIDKLGGDARILQILFD